jgi:hypothetical protein|tara:strand:+ start:128 stop:325 length:198 start_codon:yes stop_codon:yes gene_type:complete
VIVMVGDKAVVPVARDRQVNRRKPRVGHRAGLQQGVVATSPVKKIARRTSTLSSLWEAEQSAAQA